MKKYLLAVTAIAVLLSAAVVFVIIQAPDGKPPKKETVVRQEPVKSPDEYIECKYYDKSNFEKSVAGASGIKVQDASITGGITPHHLVAGRLIATLIKTVSSSDPDIVVVIAPNHKGLGVKNVQTSNLDWQTPFGILKADSETVRLLTDSRIAGSNPALMEKDHSISALVPYIKYYMPDTRIVPILLHGTYGLRDSIGLGNDLHSMLKNKKYAVIASIDFSHYLTLEKAEEMDAGTLEAIKRWDLEGIRAMGNDHLDSPPSLITFLSLMKADGAVNFKQIDHSNSARILDRNIKETTSYFTMVYYNK